jgi:phthiodiolone/phenolphthiodiolone dimycocerosates ketoreductase
MTVAGIHPWATTEMTAQLGEAAGVDSLWAGDHLLGLFHPDLWSEMDYSTMLADPDGWYDPYMVGAALSQTSSKPFGTCVTDATRRRAIDVARSALTMQHLNTGGFILGVGSGEAQSLVPFGYDFSRPVNTIENFLIELRSLLDTGRMPTGIGRIGIPLRSDAGSPQVWVAGHGPRMLRLTGQHGDGWIPGWPMTAAEYARRRELINQIAADGGRPRPTAGLVLICALGQSRETMLEQFDTNPLAKTIGLYASAEIWQKHGQTHPINPASKGFVDLIIHELNAERLREIAPTIPVEIVEEILYLGNAEEIANRARAYADAGLEYAILGNFSGIVGGATEVQQLIPDFIHLVNLLKEM